MSESAPENRRPLKSRSTAWARWLAQALAKAGASPDLISAGSVACAVLGCACFLLAGKLDGGIRVVLLVAAGVSIQMRLLCNLLDGMVAVEHGQGGPSGPIWNEMPDRIADVLFLVGAGYCAAQSGWPLGAPLGWVCAVLAVLTAYVRELGRGLGFPADFSGPMAKPHRMAALTVACIGSALEPLWGWRGGCLMAALAVIALGAALTAVGRTRTLSRRLAEAAPEQT